MTIKEFFESKDILAIHCDTRKKTIKLLSAFDKLGKRWVTGNSYLDGDMIDDISEHICYYNDGYRGDIRAVSPGISIIEFDDLDDFKNTNKLLDDVELKYLSNLLNPFKNRNVTVIKRLRSHNKISSYENDIYYLEIRFNGEHQFNLPSFSATDNMYINLKANKSYTFAELINEDKLDTKTKCNFKIGDLVKITDSGKCYSSYKTWFIKTNHKDMLSNYDFEISPSLNRDYIVVAYDHHTEFAKDIVVAIKDISGHIYLIGQNGLEAIK